MASGPEHYRDAERAFENAKSNEPGSVQERFQLDAAQFHATMAHAAATALQAALPLIGDDQQITEWGRTIGFAFTTPDLIRIDDALALLGQLCDEGLIVPAAAERLREVLGKRTGSPRTPKAAAISRYGTEFDRLADRWRALEDEHDQIHPDRSDCGGIGACSRMRTAHDLTTQMEDQLEDWRSSLAISEGTLPCGCDHHGDHAGCDADCGCT